MCNTQFFNFSLIKKSCIKLSISQNKFAAMIDNCKMFYRTINSNAAVNSRGYVNAEYKEVAAVIISILAFAEKKKAWLGQGCRLQITVYTRRTAPT